MATIEARQQAKPGPRGRPVSRRIRVAIRTVAPLSVLKFSLIFYFCVMLVVLLGLAILYGLLGALGVLDSLAQLLESTGFGAPIAGGEGRNFEFHALSIFRTLFLIGFLTVVISSALTVFIAVLYNLISDLVGGIEVTLVERR
jgi:hypothetical protein